ncbi:type II toxin-antitoxin system RelE/ParE family toxin [Sphingomonas sp. MMS24-JH45]
MALGRGDFSSGARDDLTEIGDYIAQRPPVRALTYMRELRAACADLAHFPQRFPRSPRHGDNAHRRVHGNYVIIYDVADEVVHHHRHRSRRA